MPDYSEQQYNKGYADGRFEAYQNINDQLWIRTFAGQAMQGILATVDNNFERYAADGAPQILCASAVRYAQALLAEVKKCEAEK